MGILPNVSIDGKSGQLRHHCLYRRIIIQIDALFFFGGIFAGSFMRPWSFFRSGHPVLFNRSLTKYNGVTKKKSVVAEQLRRHSPDDGESRPDNRALRLHD